ncbi:MAG: class I SAM-dependent RNA methyltransferase [Pseudomonadota bacterium]
MREVEIARLGRHGDGVHAGGETFAPLTLPGELARGEIEGGRMEAPEVLRASPERVDPPCAHFGTCGGCALQHASDAFVAAWKRERIAAALASRGLEAEIRATLTSPPRSRRRAVVSARRTRASATLGFHARRGARIVELSECHVLDPAIFGAREALRALAALGGTRKGEMKMAVTATETGLDVDVSGGRPLDGLLRLKLAAWAAEAEVARLSWAGEAVAAPRPPALRFGAAVVTPPPGAFLQATREGEAALLGAVREAAGEAGPVVDLYAGLGTFALPLAEGAEVLAVEGDAALTAALEAGWRGTGGRLKRVRVETRDLARRPLTVQELKPFAAAVLDPPRAGAKAQAEALAGSAVGRLAAISCNPETFARDARILVDGGWRLDWVQPVDQFRWSAHVELAAGFSR